MQKQKISLKRVAAGVLVGFVAITSFAGVGRAMQASVFSDLVAWVSGGPVAQMDCSPDGWWVDDGYGGGWCEYGNAGGDPYMDPNYNDPYVDPYSGGSDCSPDGWWDPNMQACQYGSPDPYYNDAGNWQDCGVNSWWDNVTQSCQTMDYSGSSCGYDQWWDNVTQSCQIMDYSWTSCGYDEYWDSYSQSCMPNGSSSGSSCASNEWWDSGNQMCQSNDYSQSSCGEGYWERCDDSGCWCESDYDSEGCYYDHTGAYICDGYGYNGGGQNCYYDQLNNWICEPGDDDYYGSNYDGYCDPDSDDDPDCYNFNDVPYCGDACYSECDDTGACWCECDADDQYSGNCYYDQNNEYICEDWGYYEGDDNMMWEDDWDDWGDDYFMDPQAWCDSPDYYWADNWGPDCFCEYGDSYFPDPNDYTKCVDHSQYGYQSCMDKGMMYNPDRKSCEENFYQHGDYDWSKQSDKSLDWGNVWQGYEEDEKDYWSQDDKWVKDEKRNMENMITESNWWAKDVKNSKEEGENWLSEIEWRCDQWGADYENMSSKGKLTSSGQDLYEDAISFCSKAKSKVNNLLGKFDDLEDDAKQAKQDMEDAYDDFVNGDEKNSEEFWDAQKGGAVNEWRDVYRSQIETWGRLLNFYDFKLEVKRIERETGASAHELGDEITEAVSFADYALSEVQDMLSTELPALITEAKSYIADGLDPWRAIDTVRDFFNDTRDILDEDRFMWDALDMSWGHANDMKMQNFMAKELEFITEELENASKEIEEMKAQGIDVTRFEGLLEEAQDILDQLEETDDEREMEDLFGRLDQIGREADMEGKKLGVAFGQHDKRGIYIETMSASVTDADAFADMLYELSTTNEDVMNKLIEILLEKITSSELDKFVEYKNKFGNIGILDSVSAGYADADKYGDLMSAKLAVLEDLDSKISILEKKIGGMEAKLQEITTKIAEYNWWDTPRKGRMRGAAQRRGRSIDA